MVGSIYQQKNLYEVFDNIWLEILQDHKGFMFTVQQGTFWPIK